MLRRLCLATWLALIGNGLTSSFRVELAAGSLVSVHLLHTTTSRTAVLPCWNVSLPLSDSSLNDTESPKLVVQCEQVVPRAAKTIATLFSWVHSPENGIVRVRCPFERVHRYIVAVDVPRPAAHLHGVSIRAAAIVVDNNAMPDNVEEAEALCKAMTDSDDVPTADL